MKNISIIFSVVLFLAVIFPASPALAETDAADAAEAIGTIIEIEGSVIILRADGTQQAAEIDQEIFIGDVIATAADSRVFLLLVDDTEWTLSENTQFKIDHYVFDPESSERNKARYSVLAGAFRYVSGLIAKRDHPDIEISVPVGNIGIRGTDITAAPDMTGGYDIYVDDGKIQIRNEAGDILIGAGQGTFVRDRATPPWQAEDWEPGRIAGLRRAVALQRREMIRERVGHIRERRKAHREEMRERARERIRDFPASAPLPPQEKREERREELRERLQERHEQRQQQRQEQPRPENMPLQLHRLQERRKDDDSPAVPQERLRERRQNLQERRHERRQDGDGRAPPPRFRPAD
ncbi:MAG: hypothetical protein EA357_01665 [Micavibrio sp.]|nr:MAG: hypothetical protein EA357_01665 [Micavibrio sp.]